MSHNQRFAFGYEPTDRQEYESYASVTLTDAAAAATFPPVIDLAWKMTPVKNQNPYNACVGFAVCDMLEIVPAAAGVTQDESERFIWYNAKNNDGLGNPNSDRGTWIPVAIANTQNQGSCWEIKCPWTDPLATPSPQAYAAAQYMKVTNAYTLPGLTLNDYKAMLSIGWPVIVGFDIFGDSSYQQTYLFGDYTTRTGIMLMPPAPVPGRTAGHAVCFVGYDDNTRLIKFKNSWGTGWGAQGYGYMPYDYLQWTHDAWVLWGQNIQLPMAIAGVSISGVGTLATTDTATLTIGKGKQPKEVH